MGDLPGQREEARSISGRAHLAAGRPDRAISDLSHVAGAEPLVAAAHERAGRYAEARALYAELGRPEDAARMSLRLADWGDLAGRGEGALAGAAARLAEPAPTPPPDAGPQRLAADLLERSKADRDAFQGLLGQN
jgi:hypothetical protein